MVIMNVKLDNVLAFSDFKVNFSYPIKLRRSIIENEELSNVPGFRYKKLNVFIGSNASGKTSFIKALWNVLLFLDRKEKAYLEKIINKKKEHSYIEIDLVTEENSLSILHRFEIKTTNQESGIKVEIAHKHINLERKTSYEVCSKKLEGMPRIFEDYLNVLERLKIHLHWNVILPATEESFERVMFFDLHEKKDKEKEYIDIMNIVLKTLDPAILGVNKSKDADNAYVVDHSVVGKIIVQDGFSLSSIEYLSSGTKYGFNIANIIFAIKNHVSGIYMIDEQFSYVNTDIEAAILSTMVSLLGPDEQIFFTTHNYDIASLGFPFHSFYFMNKEIEEGKLKVKINCASEAENRNNVVPRSLLDNDVFSISPKVDAILNLGDEIDG